MSLISNDNSWNVLWYLYAEGLLWVRNSAQMGSVKSVSSVRDKTTHDSYWQAYRGNLTFHSPPYGGGEGGGATSSWVRNVRKKALLTLWALWEKKLPSVLFVCSIIERVRSISHRRTQMNRTHSIPQRPCGRQISQNLTAIFSWNALWSLYAEGLLWARNCAQKCSVNSVRSVRDNIPTRIKQCAKTLC